MSEQSAQTTAPLSHLPYDEKFKLNQASCTQLIRGLYEMGQRLEEPQNDYQRELYPVLKSVVSKVFHHYEALMTSTSETEANIRKYNLDGYNGRVKKPISTRGVKYNLIYKYANFGDYLKTLNQRMHYLVNRPLPQRYINNVSEGVAYTDLKTKLQEFMKFMKDDIEVIWNTAVSAARTAGGVQPKTRPVVPRQPTREFKPRQHKPRVATQH
jgi:hypothetical protein